jgi:hypothetical protein
MDGQKIIILMMCFSVIMYLMGFQLVDGDILNRMYNTDNLDVNADSTNVNLNSNVQNAIPKTAQNSGGLSVQAFIDGLSLIWSLALLIFNLLTSPIAIFSFLPPVIAIMIGIPFSFMYLLSILKFIRGADL